MLSAATLAVISIADDYPFLALGLVMSRYLGNGLSGLACKGVYGPHKGILAELAQMTTVAKPGTGW